LLAAVASAAPPVPLPMDAEIRAAGRAWLDEQAGVGLSIGIYDNGQRRFYNFGGTQIGGRMPTQDSVYEIGSISKTFTGQLLARAIVEGRAQLEDEVTAYLDAEYPNLVNGGQRVRLLHLVNNTSQLFDNIPDLTQVRYVSGESLAVTQMRVLEKYSRAEFLRQLRAVMPRAAPGSPPVFSNVGSMLLGVALEKIYGAPFDALLSREIEKPLRMNSGVAPPARLVVQSHTSANDPLPALTGKVLLPALALRYSASDLLSFAAWQLAERDASVKLAHRPTWTQPDGRQSVAFQWIVGESPKGRRLRQTGSTFGFAAAVELYPEAKIAVVLLANKNTEGAQETLRALSADIVGLLRPVAGTETVVSPQPSSAGAPQPVR
jgi:CubicO group peptidase (beta-lactamase class C family)